MRSIKDGSETGGSNPPLSSQENSGNHSGNSSSTELSAVLSANGLPQSAVPEANEVGSYGPLVGVCEACSGTAILHVAQHSEGESHVCEACLKYYPDGREREAMAAEATRSLASRGLVPADAPALRDHTVLDPRTPFFSNPGNGGTDGPAEHGEADLPVAVRPAGSAPGVAAPALRPMLSADGSAWLCPRCLGEAHRLEDAGVKSTVCTSRGAGCWSWAGWPPEASPPVLPPGWFSVPGAIRVKSPSWRPDAHFVVCDDGAGNAVDHPESEVCGICRIRVSSAPAPAAEVRTCSVREPGAAYEGRVLERCEAVLGDDVLCSVCGGGSVETPHRAKKCYTHCGSFQHYGGPLVMTTVIENRWRLVMWASGLSYLAEVRDMGAPASGQTLLKPQFSGQDADKVIGEAMTLIDGLRNAQPGWGVPVKLPYTPPTVRPITREEAQRVLRVDLDRGDETCSEADGFDPEEWQGVTLGGLAQAVRAPRASGSALSRRDLAAGLERLALEIGHAWGELEEADERVGFGDAITRARALADAAVCAVAALLAGGVR